ncbi:MAG: nucleotidyl transferase AbiEii/AbiGii toxin family protein [Muribaculaceae bacterium]|nr:nucleotidyl transferase AbiEii/AbiGii toxin family protein [Muribaculaceae bacterium]
MIHPDSRSMEWINSVSAQYPSLDKTLIEKTIRAFSLLESLSISGCPFTFKGGTACMLHLGSSKRLSIDIDIICPPGTDISQYVKAHSNEYGFTDIQLVERLSSHNVPKSHAKCYYKVSYVTRKEEEAILLDVLFEEIHYEKVVQRPIVSPFLKMVGEPAMVNLPSAEDILGDKLTAFAPHTSGIHFFKKERNCSLEIIKQMFDVAALFDVCYDFALTHNTFHKFGETELGYRNLEGITTNDILIDAIKTAQCISLRGLENEEEFNLLQGGIKRIGGLILSERYHLESAIRDSAKTAYVAALILTHSADAHRYESTPIQYWKDAVIDKVLTTKFNKLKKSNQEAFFYWWQVDKLLNLLN